MNMQDILALPAPNVVYCAVVAADDGPGTSKVTLLDATWASLTEARDHIERRVPDLLANRTGMRFRAAVVLGETSINWELRPTARGVEISVPIQHLNKDWNCAEHAEVHPNGKVTW